MIKAIFFDIDGTLLSHKTNSVPASTVRALELLRQKGILTFIATGRNYHELPRIAPLQGLSFDGAVTLNGQYCRNDREVLYRNPIDPSDIATLIRFLEEHPHPALFVEEGQMYINFHNDHVARVQAAIHSELPPIGDLRRGYEQPIYQVMLYMTDREQKALPPMPNVKLTSWHLGGADLIPATGGKAAGIAKVLAHYGIDKSETMAFGDGENDVDMFRAVGTAVAMGNAVASAKASADYVTDKVLDDGIWNALKHFGVL